MKSLEVHNEGKDNALESLPEVCLGNWMLTIEQTQKRISFIHLGPRHPEMVCKMHVDKYLDVHLEKTNMTPYFTYPHWKPST